jgi:hypothetical protein
VRLGLDGGVIEDCGDAFDLVAGEWWGCSDAALDVGFDLGGGVVAARGEDPLVSGAV